MKIPDNDLEALFRSGEGYRVERKESLDGEAKTAIAEAICAFANDLAGDGEPGVIFVGAKDQASEPSGFVPDERALQTLMGMKTDGRISPPPSMLVEARTVAGLPLAVATVLPSTSPPVRFNGRVHVRAGARRGLATEQDERLLAERRRHLDRFYDIRPLHGLTLDALNLRVFDEDYLPAAFPAEIWAANNRTVEQRLASTGMIVSVDDTTPTVLGMMALGREPRRHLHNFYVLFLQIDGIGLADPIVDSEEIDGMLANIVKRIDDKLGALNQVSVDITSAPREIRRSSYSLAALQQLVRNAIMHRSYEATNAPIRVTCYRDRIEIQNPGGPYGAVTRENFGRPGVVDYRNPNLTNAMKGLGYVQRFGVGIEMARQALAAAGHPDLEFDVQDTHITAIVRGAGA